jgi:hypothetical protein
LRASFGQQLTSARLFCFVFLSVWHRFAVDLRFAMPSSAVLEENSADEVGATEL